MIIKHSKQGIIAVFQGKVRVGKVRRMYFELKNLQKHKAEVVIGRITTNKARFRHLNDKKW